MRFWISGEVFHDVDKEYGLATDAVSKALNADLGSVDYGIPVKSWNVIGILLPPSIPGFEEVRRYEPDKREVEFRLRLYYPLFQAAESPEERQWIIFKMILRSVDLFRQMADLPSEIDKFRSDILAVGRKHGWGEKLVDDDGDE
jgi:hypothetical protein